MTIKEMQKTISEQRKEISSQGERIRQLENLVSQYEEMQSFDQSRMTIARGVAMLLHVVNNIECEITRREVIKKFIHDITSGEMKEIHKEKESLSKKYETISERENNIFDIIKGIENNSI